jgi:hypothetical protein
MWASISPGSSRSQAGCGSSRSNTSVSAAIDVEEVQGGTGNDTIDTRGLTVARILITAWTSVPVTTLSSKATPGLPSMGAGNDTLVLSGNLADYTYAEFPGSANLGDDSTITNKLPGALDVVSSVEIFKFADATVAYHDLFI